MDATRPVCHCQSMIPNRMAPIAVYKVDAAAHGTPSYHRKHHRRQCQPIHKGSSNGQLQRALAKRLGRMHCRSCESCACEDSGRAWVRWCSPWRRAAWPAAGNAQGHAAMHAQTALCTGRSSAKLMSLAPVADWQRWYLCLLTSRSEALVRCCV